MGSTAVPVSRPGCVPAKPCRVPPIRLLSPCFVLVIVLTSGGSTRAQAPLPADAVFDIKASFVYTLAKFVTWPARVFPSRETPILFCILNDDPLGSALERVSAGRTIGGRPIALHRVTTPVDADACQLLLIGGFAAERIPGLLARSRSAGVLTIGEAEEFTEHGGIVRLRMNQDMVQAEVNQETAERAGLRISSNFLRLSGIVTLSPPAGRQ